MSTFCGSGTSVILVVEDEWFVRADIAEQLRDAGFDVFEAETGERALDFAANGHGVDVVFTDIWLGGEVNGWDVGEAFRTAQPDVGVIYASAAATQPTREVAESRFFKKPYRGWEIVETCHELGGRSRNGGAEGN